jgi:hypothetical protein
LSQFESPAVSAIEPIEEEPVGMANRSADPYGDSGMLDSHIGIEELCSDATDVGKSEHPDHLVQPTGIEYLDVVMDEYQHGSIGGLGNKVALRRITEIAVVLNHGEPVGSISQEVTHRWAEAAIVEDQDLHVRVRRDRSDAFDATSQSRSIPWQDDHADQGGFVGGSPPDAIEAAPPDRRHLGADAGSVQMFLHHPPGCFDHIWLC